MAKFDWVPYLEGKYLHYYQWFAVIATAALLLISFLSFFLYLVLCKISPSPPSSPRRISLNKSLIQKLKNITFNGSFICLTIIPLVWQALDGINILEGILGMLAISAIQIYLDNGRRLWKAETPIRYQASTLKTYLKLCLQLTPESIKLLKIAVVCAVIFNFLMYKTCISFFNVEIGWYSHSLGIGINTYVSRHLQLRESCPVGPPCHLYATVPEDPSYAFFLNIHTHKEVGQVTVFYQELDC